MIPALLSKYLVPGLCVALLVAIAAGAVQTARIGTLKAEQKALESEYATLLDTATGKDDTISRLDAANLAIRTALAAQGEALARAVGIVATYRTLIAAQSKALTEAEKADHELPDCKALLAVDLYSICPAHAASVRQRASGNLSRPID